MKEYRIFFAIPFDSATSNLYNRVRDTLKVHYPNITLRIGTDEVGPSPSYSDIVTFKAQNTELNRVFVDEIRRADIVVADLTHNNPNVHVELGIALSQNKNVLRVTGRALKELGFDIQNLDVFQYKGETELTNQILRYLKTFFEIKRLPLSPQYPPLYREDSTQIQLRSGSPQVLGWAPNVLGNAQLRDGSLEIEFEITRTYGNDNWFGVYFRVNTSPLFDSHLVHVRPDGSLWAVRYPGQVPVANTPGTALGPGSKKKLVIEFENNYLEARIDNTQLNTDKLSQQAIGGVWLGTYSADADVYSMKMICRDTIDPNP